MRKLLANLGDVNPIDYGGVFVYQTGEKTGEIEVLHPYGDDRMGNAIQWTVHRFEIPQCTLINGVLSDNPFHPDLPAWFAEKTAEISGMYELEDKLENLLCHDDIVQRAIGYQYLYEWFGLVNFDQYPQEYTDREFVYDMYKETV